jgi:hypothetical protein
MITSTTDFICEQGDDKLIKLNINDPCDVSGYDFSSHGSTRAEHCGCEWTSSSQVDSYSMITE